MVFWSCLALFKTFRSVSVDRGSSQHDVPACSLWDSCPIQTDLTGSRGDGQHNSNMPIVSISATIPIHLVSEFHFRMLSFVYQQPFSGTPDPRPLLSLSTAASVYAHRGRLLLTLATRGAGNTLKMTLTDMTYTRSDTITMNMEQAQNVILAVSDVLTTNRREETAEGKKQHREERDLKEVHGQVSPITTKCHHE
jgi:hypothetical protein